MGRRGTTAGDERRLVLDPAGFDDALRTALEEVKAGYWRAMRDLLADEHASWGTRTSRTRVLASAAAGSHIVQEWRAEEPGNPDAVVMEARVAVARALRARARQLAPGELGRLESTARQACHDAIRRVPHDPVPWVALLALAQLDELQNREEHRVPAPDPLLPPGPWELLREAHSRDRYNREAFHRMTQCLPSHTEVGGFVRWVVERRLPKGSALWVLPLYANVNVFRHVRGRSEAVLLWSNEHAVRAATRAFDNWFRHSTAEYRSVLDLNYLAHALWAMREHAYAALVFEALGPYYTTQPWADVGDGMERAKDGFRRARRTCLQVAGASSTSAPSPRQPPGPRGWWQPPAGPGPRP